MKKLICRCAVLLLLFAAFPARAAEPLSLNAEGYVAEQGTVRLYWNTNLGRVPAASELSLQVGNQTLPITGIQTVAKTGEGTTYLFLIDISGSIGEKKLGAIKQTLLSVVGKMNDKDNAGVLLVGDEVEIQPLTSDKAALNARIEGIASGTKTTNLYLGITKGLDLLATDAKSNHKKCLVVLSDGEDYAVKGITREEVEKKIAALRIPVYTVAMLGENPKGSYVESAKILGSFARLSPGGRDLMHGLKEEASEAAAKDILSSVSGSLVLTADLNGLSFAGNEQYMKLELNAGTAGKVSDGYSIATGALTAAQITPAPSAAVTATP
ncbi:MAG TPA: VWA domain-containing protein, partial [Feifaniaceae bacterium]|nr:VWA domain-containing protein [Feifaniaceae bacterium]